MKNGTLFLIPVFLSDSEPQSVFPAVNLEIIKSLDHFIVEDLRTARRFLRKVGFLKDFDKLHFYLLNEHTDPKDIGHYLDEIGKGVDIGLMSEAGTPCIADPGFEIVDMAHHRGVRVKPLVGPSSIMQALMASGLNGQQFVFYGYLPIEKNERKKAILNMELAARKNSQTQIFIETPYRNNKLLDDLLNICADQTMLCIACDITGENEFIKTRSIRDWKKTKIDIHKKPAVFIMNSTT